MKNLYNKSLVAIALAAALSPASQAVQHDSRGLVPDSGQQLTVASQSKRDIDNRYMVVLRDPSLATYKGGINDLQATSLLVNTKNKRTDSGTLDTQSRASQSYLSYLQTKQSAVIAQAKSVVSRDLDIKSNYRIAINGFSTDLTEEEAASLRGLADVAYVQKVQRRHLTTDSGPSHIQAPSVWDGTATGTASQGEGVIVGILDTGISAFNPSFADIGGDGYDHTNPLGEGVYLGDCATAELAHYCNDKLIGIWGHPGVLADYTPEGDDLIAIDHNGHGSHTASTAAGNIVMNVPVYNVVGDLAEYEFGQISGVAPHANIVSYQVCAADDGCWTDVSAMAVEHAIENGVQVLNYSVGGGSSDPWYDTDAYAFLSAREAGIHVATSAGNSGPDPETVGSPGNAPWITTVAAYTHDRSFTDKEISFSGGDTSLSALEGEGATSGITANIVDAADFGDGDCLEPFADGTFAGEIVVCRRGDIARVSKGSNVLAGGAGGLVLINVDGGAETVDEDFHVLPAIHLDATQGQSVLDWMSTGEGHSATISASLMEKDADKADVAAWFTSRGPEAVFNQWLTPHVAAPGVAIYAANSEYQPWRDEKTESPYTFMDGTSMSSPHVAGAMALITAVKPEWTPAQVQSALMLTAEFDTLKDDGVTPSDFFDGGAGSIRIEKALNTGLTMDETFENYVAANPSEGGDPSSINMAAALKNGCLIECTWTRTFTAEASSTWNTSGSATTAGFEVSASPASFTLEAGESVDLTVTAKAVSGFASEYGMGHLHLTPEDANLTPSAMPVIGTFKAGAYPENTVLETNQNQGSGAVPGITTIGSDDIQVTTFELAEVEVYNVEIPRDDSDNANWPTNVYNDGTYYYSQLINITPSTKRVVARITNTTSPDLDLYIGRDSNYNGRPDDAMEMGDLLCMSADETAYESCAVNNPAAGSYYVAVHNFGNYDAPSGDMDSVTLEVSVIGGDDGTVSADFKQSVAAQEDIDLVLNWDKQLQADTRYMTVVEVGTGATAPDNVGIVPVELYRVGTAVSSSIDTTDIDSGDAVTLSINIDSNLGDQARELTISTAIPTGWSVASDSHGATVDGMALTWTVSQAAGAGADTIELVLDTTNVTMSDSVSFEVTVVDGEQSYSQTLGPVAIQGYPVALINGEASVEVSADEQTDVVLSATSSTVPNADDQAVYSWVQVSGPEVMIDDAAASEINITLPDVTEDSIAVLELTVANTDQTSAAATVSINIVAEQESTTPDPDPVVTPPSSGGSSSGSIGISALLLTLAGLRRRIK